MCYRWLVGFIIALHGGLVVTESENGTKVNDGDVQTIGNLDFNPSTTPDQDFFVDGLCPESNCSDYASNISISTITDRVGERSCNCDKKCADFRDCCSDSKYYDREEQKKPSEYECPNNYYVKSICPSSWQNNEIREKCLMSGDYLNLNIKNVELRIPATSLKTNITYGNLYCAMCHSENNVKLWKIQIEYHCELDYESNIPCKDLRNITISKLQFNNTRWYFVHNDTFYLCNLVAQRPENISLEYCGNTFVVNTCPLTWTDLDMKEKCDGPYLRVAHRTRYVVYKNKYCAYCNGANESDLSCHISYFDVNVISQTPSLTILFDFKLELPSKQCKNNHISLAQQQICIIEENTTYISSDENWFFSAYTSVAILISLICLIIHLTIFSLVQELHTIGGKNMVSYCVALTLAYGTFLLGNLAEGVVCVTTAVLMYYFFLSAFTWMLTISFDIWRTFWNATKHLRSPSDTRKTFLLYSSWSWSAPLIPVLITIYLQYFEIDYALAPHFGESSCWFQNGHSLLVFFVEPVCLIITLNFAFFLHTSVMVYSNQCPSVNQKTQVDFKLFARIAVLTGFTWITGFIGGYTESLIIWFIFIVLNTAQGVFIFIAFSCKKRIIYSFLKRIDMFENWQIMLKESMTRSNDAKSTTLNNVVQTTDT